MRRKGQEERTDGGKRQAMPFHVIAGGGLLLTAALMYWINAAPSAVLNPPVQAVPLSTRNGYRLPPEKRELGSFVKVLLASNGEVWGRIFAEHGQSYRNPQLVLYSGQVASPCGMAREAGSPFYCPGDQKLYLDLNYLARMEQQWRSSVSFKEAGDFALAYVVAHEFGHHIQTLLAVGEWMEVQRCQMNARSFRRLQVRFELQADYLAGIWAHYAGKWSPELLGIEDIEGAVKMVNVVGDDRIQKQLQERPETFMCGTSEQRARWFYKGYSSGNLGGANTFLVPDSEL